VRSLVALLAVLLLGGCGTATPTPDASPAEIGGVWTAVEVDGFPTVPASEPRLQFENDGRVLKGITGCGAFSTDVAIDRNRISIGRFDVTDRVDCDADRLRVERGFLAVLTGAQRISGTGGRLLIESSAGSMRLARGSPELTEAERATADRLESADWEIVQADGMVVPPQFPTLRFAGGTLSAVPGCGFSGTYRLLGEDDIRMSQFSWDAIECPDPLADGARFRLTSVLELADRFRISEDGTDLVITGRRGQAAFSAALPTR
jgi:heat shock protein HslJ